MISRFHADIGMAGATALFGAVIAWGATEFGVGWSPSGPQPGTFPFFIGCIVTVASLGNAALAFAARHAGDAPFVTREQAGLIARFVLPIIAFVPLSLVLGLYVATAIYMTGVMVWQGRYPLWKALSVGIGLPLALYVLLERGFQVSLLKGPLETMLGL